MGKKNWNMSFKVASFEFPSLIFNQIKFQFNMNSIQFQFRFSHAVLSTNLEIQGLFRVEIWLFNLSKKGGKFKLDNFKVHAIFTLRDIKKQVLKLFKSFRLRLKFSCMMELSRYPLDRQICDMQIASCKFLLFLK